MKTKQALVISLILLLSCFSIQTAYAGSSGTSTGTATVAGDFTITSIELLDGSQVDKNASALTVNTAYHVNFTLSDEDGMDDITNITVRVWDSSDAITENTSDTERYHMSFEWNTDLSGNWSEPTLSGFLSLAGCDSSNSSGATQYEFCVAFDLSKVANHVSNGNTDWKVTIFGYDEEGNSDLERDATSVMFGVSAYAEMTGLESTHSWLDLSPGSSDNIANDDSDDDIDLTVICNYKWNITSMANHTALINQYSDEINIGNVTINGANNAGASVSLTTDPTTATVPGLTGMTAPTTESGTADEVYLWIDIPSEQPPGDYEYELTLEIVEDET